MRKILLLIVLFGATITGLRAQVGIGTKKPDLAAQLDIKSDTPTKKGLLIPRVELDDLEMLLTGVTGKSGMPQSILVFNTNNNITGYDGKTYGIGYYYWDENINHASLSNGNGAWVPLLSGGSAANINNFFNTFNTDSSTVVYNKTDNTLKVNVGNGLKEYVDGATTYVGLGGDLKEDTTIKFATKKLKLEGVPMTDKYDDKILVWNEGSKEFKYSNGINVKQISAVDPATGNSDANKGKILTVDSSGTVTWTSLGGANSIDLTNVAGNGLTYSTTTGKLNVEADSGLRIEDDKVRLGGKLLTSTTIVADDTNTLAIKGLKTVTTDTDALVVVDPSTGVLKKIKGVSVNQIVSDANNAGKILTVVTNTAGEGVVTWTTIDASNTKTIDLSGVAGDGLTYSATTGKLGVKAGNGITIDPTDNTVDWGGKLTKTATIETTAGNGFEIKPEGGTGNSNVVIEKLPNGDPGDNLVVVDGDGKLKQISALDAATINYTSEPQKTGRKWKIGGDYEVKEITIEVEFKNETTVKGVFTEIQGKDSDLTAKTAAQLKPINIRAIEKDNAGATSISQSGTYDPQNGGELTLGMNGSMFAVTHNGIYYIVIEYYVK